MQRFFFHVRDGKDFPDLQGTEFPDLKAARKEALRFAGALLSDAPETFWSGNEWSLTVTDSQRLTLFELTFIATDAPSVGSSPRP